MSRIATRFASFGLAAALVAGCGKEGSGGAGHTEEKGAHPVTPKAAAVGPQEAAFAPWMQAKAAAAWQGAWVSRLQFGPDAPGMQAALDIKGDKATFFDGTSEQQLEFHIDTPCSVRFTRRSASGSSESHTTQFLLVGDKVVVDVEPVGMRKGKAAVVCEPWGAVFVLDDKGTCTRWERPFDKDTWESKPAQCEWEVEVGKEFLVVSGMRTWSIAVDGDLLKPDNLGEEITHERMTDYAAAKAAVLAGLKAD